MATIAPERKFWFNVGTGMMILGGVLFFSNFIIFLMATLGSNSGPLSTGLPQGAAFFGSFSMVGFVIRAFGGVMLLGAGQGVRHIAARGVAGGGLILDPQQARKDLEPWSRMGGAMVKDALDEAQLTPKAPQQPTSPLTLENRLRRLQHLKQQGLISEEEYTAQRQRIIESA